MKKVIVLSGILAAIVISVTMNSCNRVSAVITTKSGAQIWGENCVRCHNIASPETFSDVEWDVAAMHMKIRANLTQEETKKVIKFLQSAN